MRGKWLPRRILGRRKLEGGVAESAPNCFLENEIKTKKPEDRRRIHGLRL